MKKLKTGAEYRHDMKKRVQKHREKMREAGYKNITVFISKEFHDELEDMKKNQGLTKDAAIEVIFQAYLKNRSVTSNSTVKETPVKTSDVTSNEIVKDSDLKTADSAEVEPQPDQEPDADTIIIEMAAEQDQRKEKRDWKTIAKRLNDAGLLTEKGKPWTNDNVRMKYNRLKKPTS